MFWAWRLSTAGKMRFSLRFALKMQKTRSSISSRVVRWLLYDGQRVGTEPFRKGGPIYSDLLDTRPLSRLPRALPIAPRLAANSSVRAVDAFSQCITAAKLLPQSLCLIQQRFTLRNE